MGLICRMGTLSLSSRIPFDLCSYYDQVLFTADLRSFATYGLPSPTPSPVKPGVSPKTPSSAATPPSKRKRGFKTLDLFEAETEGDMLPQLPPVGADDAGEVPVGIADTMAERVKRRRRGAAGPPA
jgi:N-glycosylase/DNA lyase